MAAAEAEMEFGSMKRKELQALCKKHGIPANKTNREMALLLTIAIKVNEPSAVADGGEDLDEEDDREVPRKRVRFSPEVETREYEPTARKPRGRTTRVSAKVKKDVHVDDHSKNLEEDGLSEGGRKLVKECAEPGKGGRRGKRNAAKGKDCEPMLVAESKSSEVGGRITRLRARSQSTCDTSADANEGQIEKASAPAGNMRRTRRKTAALGARNVGLEANRDAEAGEISKEDGIEKGSAPVAHLRSSRRKTVVLGTIHPIGEVGGDESVKVEEIPKHVNRKPTRTRQKSAVLQEEKFEGAEGKLTNKASKVPTKSKLEAKMADEASVVDNLHKVSAPIGNLRRSRRKPIVDEMHEAESFEVEGTAKAVDINPSGWNASGRTKGSKRKADKLLSKLEVIVETEPSAASNENIKAQKAPVPAANNQRSRRKTVVLSPVSEDNAVGNVEVVESLPNISEQVPGDDEEPINESRQSSNEAGKTTDTIEEVVPQSRKGKRVRQGTHVAKRESVVGKPRQAARANSKSSKVGSCRIGKPAEKWQHTTIRSPITTVEASKSIENIVPAEESPIEELEIGPAGSAQNECSGDSRKQTEGTPSAASSELVSSSIHQGLPIASAVSEKTHPEVTEERNVGFVPALSEEKPESLYSSGGGVYPVSPERNKSSEGTENMKKISVEPSLELGGASMDEETAGSSRKPASTSQEANTSGDDSNQRMGEFPTEDNKDEQFGQSSEEVNHGNLGQPEQYERTENMKKISVEPSLELVGASTDEETAGSSRKPVSTCQEANASGDDCHQGMRDFGIEDNKDEQLGQCSEEFSHGDLDQSEQPRAETRASEVDNILSENQMPLVGEFSSSLEFNEGKGRQEHLTIEPNQKSVPDDESLEAQVLSNQEGKGRQELLPIEPNQKSVPDDEPLEAEILSNQEETTLGHKFSQECKGLVIEVSAKVLETNKYDDFFDEMNEQEENASSSELDAVQTGVTSQVKCLVAPLPTLAEHRNSSLEANDACEAACAQEISNHASEKELGFGEKGDVEVSDIQPEPAIFTEWVESDQQTMKNTLMTDNSAISEEADGQVAEMELEATNGASMKWEKNKSPINQTVASVKDKTFDLPNTLSSGQGMASPKAARDSAGVAKAFDSCSPQFCVDNLVAEIVLCQGTLDVHEHGAGGASEEVGSLASAEDQSESRHPTPGMTTGLSSLTRQHILASPRTSCMEVSQLPVEANSNKIEDTMDGNDGLALNRLSFENDIECLVDNASSVCNGREQVEESEVFEKNIQSRSKATVDSSGLSTSGAYEETETMGLNILFEGQDVEADTAEADDRALLNDDSRMLQPNQVMSKQITEMELETTDGVAKKWEHSSPFNQTVDNCEDGTLDIHHMLSPGRDMMSPKAATGGSVGVTESFDTHAPQFSIDDLKVGSIQYRGALDVEENEAGASEEFKWERSYPIPGITGNGSSLPLQNVLASPSRNDIEGFQLLWEADSNRLAEAVDCQKTSESAPVPEGYFIEGETNLQEVENDQKCSNLKSAKRENNPLTIGEEVEASGKEENALASSINCPQQFLHNQGSTAPSEEVLSMNMEKALDGVYDHSANHEAEECPQATMPGPLSYCKDAAVSDNGGSEEKFTEAPCQESVTYVGEKMQLMVNESRDMQTIEASNQEEATSETEDDPSDTGVELVTKETANALDGNEHQDFCRVDEMNATREASSTSLEANEAYQAACIQEISNLANENSIVPRKDNLKAGNVHSHGDQDSVQENGAGGEPDQLCSSTTAEGNPERSSLVAATIPDMLPFKLQHFPASPKAEEAAESMGLNLPFVEQDGKAASSSPEIVAAAAAADNDETTTEEEGEPEDDAASMVPPSPFCIPLTNSFAPLCLDMSPGDELPPSPSLSLSSQPQNVSGKERAAIDDDEVNLPSPRIGEEVKDGGGEVKQENLPWSSELMILRSPKVLRTPLGQDAASDSLMEDMVPSSAPFVTTRKPRVHQRTTGKVFGGDAMKENEGRGKLDMQQQQQQQLGNVTAPAKTLAAGTARRRPLQELAIRRRD